MKMVVELLIPCVQDTDKAQLAAQLVFPEAQQRLRDGFKQKRQHHGFVVQDNDVQFVGQCKDEVKVADRKQFFFAGLDPSFSGYLLAFGARWPSHLPTQMLRLVLKSLVLRSSVCLLSWPPVLFGSSSIQLWAYGSARKMNLLAWTAPNWVWTLARNSRASRVELVAV